MVSIQFQDTVNIAKKAHEQSLFLAVFLKKKTEDEKLDHKVYRYPMYDLLSHHMKKSVKKQ